jgi:formate dehydrogenase subunit gamma
MTRDAESELTIVRDILASAPAQQDSLLPLLQQIQNRLGFVPSEALALIAHALNLSRAEVYGVASFYHDLRHAPCGRHVIQLCQAEACQAVGCRALLAHAEQRLGVAVGETSTDGLITLQRAYCFGNCACGPTLRIGDRLLGRVGAADFDDLVDTLRAQGAPQ